MKVLWSPIYYKIKGNYLKTKYGFFINWKQRPAVKWLRVRLRTKWFWVRVQLQSRKYCLKPPQPDTLLAVAMTPFFNIFSIFTCTVADHYVLSDISISHIRPQIWNSRPRIWTFGRGSRQPPEGLTLYLKTALQILGRYSWDQISGQGFHQIWSLN